MTEAPQTPAPPEPREPTAAEIMAIAEKASREAAEAKSIAEAHSGVKETVIEEGEAQGLAISDEDAQKIADTTIDTLKSLGAFENKPEAPAAPPAEGEEKPNEGEAPEGTQPAGPQEPAADEPPGKRTFAEKFMGR
jgi:hypothetical protein